MTDFNSICLPDYEDPLNDFYVCEDHWYRVSRLVNASKGLPVYNMPIATLCLECHLSFLNLRDVAGFFRRMILSDLDTPIILNWDGALADGRHRIAKALYMQHTYIKGVRLTTPLDPCHVGWDAPKEVKGK